MMTGDEKQVAVQMIVLATGVIGVAGVVLRGSFGIITGLLGRKKTIVHRTEYGPAGPGCGMQLFLMFRGAFVGCLVGGLLGVATAATVHEWHLVQVPPWLQAVRQALAETSSQHPEEVVFGGGIVGAVLGLVRGMFVKPARQ